MAATVALHGIDIESYLPIEPETDWKSSIIGVKIDSVQDVSQVDVLIVGAGPSGLLAALWMAELGVRTRIIDKRGTRALNGRADCLHVRSMEIWESFGMVDTVLKNGTGISEWCLWVPDSEGHIQRKQRKCALGTDLSRFPLGMLHQGHAEATLIDAIRRRSGAEVERGTVPTSIEVNESLENEPNAYPIKVELSRLYRKELERWETNSHTKKADGTRKVAIPDIAFPVLPRDDEDITDRIDGREGANEIVHAKYVIGADGAQSWVRRHLGLKMNGSDKDVVWGVIDLVPVSNFPDFRKNCTIQSTDGTVIVAPREKGLVRIYVQFREDLREDTALEQIIEKIKMVMSPYEFDYTFCDWWTIYRVNQKLSDHFSYKDRVFLVGDAAHTHTPKGGQGMNIAMQDSYNIGWKLGLVARGHANKSLLKTYEEERRPVAKGLIEMDEELSRILKSKSPVSVEETRQVYEILRALASGVSIHYATSMINVDPMGLSQTNVKVGIRFPNFKIYNHATGLQAELQQLLQSDGRWRLLVFAGTVSKRLQLDRVNVLGEQLCGLTQKYQSVQEGKPFLDVNLIHASRESEIEITEFHNTYFTFDAQRGWDYDRVFTRVTDGPHEDPKSISPKHGLGFGTECMILIRPDQHVGLIDRLDGYEALEQYFAGFMIPQNGQKEDPDF